MADRLKVMMKPCATGELTPMLCDVEGNPLPGQVSVNIETVVDDVARVTVQFVMVEFANPEGGGVESLRDTSSETGATLANDKRPQF